MDYNEIKSKSIRGSIELASEKRLHAKMCGHSLSASLVYLIVLDIRFGCWISFDNRIFEILK